MWRQQLERWAEDFDGFRDAGVLVSGRGRGAGVVSHPERSTGTARPRCVPRSREESTGEARAVLDDRLARGGLTPDEYLARREMLSH